MTDFIVTVILLAIVAGIVFYLYREKKRGVTCVGCPYAKQCAKNHGSCKGSCRDTGKQK